MGETLNRREFLKMLGIGTATTVVFGTGLWKPPRELMLLNNCGDIIVSTGYREDLMNILQNCSPLDTLYLSGFEKVPANDIVQHWLIDELR